MTPSVLSNTKWRCKGCGAIEDFPFPGLTQPCRSCGESEWAGIPVVLVCDFCGDNVNDRWRFPASDFEMPTPAGYPGPKQMSEGDWCACEVCARLIEADKLRKLSIRALRKLHGTTESGGDDPFLMGMMIEAHQRFAQHRTGPPVLEREGGTDVGRND